MDRFFEESDDEGENVAQGDQDDESGDEEDGEQSDVDVSDAESEGTDSEEELGDEENIEKSSKRKKKVRILILAYFLSDSGIKKKSKSEKKSYL